jgi:hypothetical protein
MDARYHIALTRTALKGDFDEAALAEVIAANLGQDALRYQLGSYPHFHFDNNRIAAGLSYVEDQHAAIVSAASEWNGPRMRAALGHIFHAVQDFYAHANYVDLWLDAQEGPTRPPAKAIDGLDKQLLTHPDLRTGTFVMLRDLVYYVPLIGRVARKIYVPPKSHEGMNLDSPSRGWRFRYAFRAAYQRTCAEYHRAKKAVVQTGDEAALRAFVSQALEPRPTGSWL